VILCAIRIASHLVVREPRVGAFDRPPQTHRLLLRGGGCALHSLLPFGDHRIVDPALGETGSGDVRVVAAVEPERLDVDEQTSLGHVVQRGGQLDRVITVRTLCGLPDGVSGFPGCSWSIVPTSTPASSPNLPKSLRPTWAR